MKKLLIVSAILSMLATQAFAGNANNFAGPNASFGLGLTSYTSQYKYRGSDAQTTTDLGQNSIQAVLNASYLKEVNADWLVGVGASYYMGSTVTGRSRNFTSGTDYHAKTTAKNHYAIYVQPTYALNSSTALFAKIAYHTIKVNLQDPNGQLFSGFQEYKSTLKGVGYGIGLMSFLNKNVFVKTEIEYIDYGRTNVPYSTASGNLTYKLTSVGGILSLGYKF